MASLAGSTSARARRPHPARWLAGVTALLASCAEPSRDEEPAPGPPVVVSAVAEPAPAPIAAVCDHPVPHYDGGRPGRALCPEEIAAMGLTVVDLSDDWAPPLFAEEPALGARGRQPHRETLVALANERFGEGPEWDGARRDRYLELYGIFPSVAVVRARLLDGKRHACHDAVDDAALERLDRPLDPWRDLDRQRSDRAFARTLFKKLVAEEKRRGLASIDALEADTYYGKTLEQHRRLGTVVDAVAATQAHLRCDGLLSARAEESVFDHRTTEALKAFHRKHMIVSWQLDLETKRALLTDSRELDFRALLRVLRERVVAATGLVEDGSAAGQHGKVVDRELDAEAFGSGSGAHEPIPGAAPDLIAAATDAAARALGWTSPAAARDFLDAAGPDGSRELRVAVKLPPVPAYHSAEMALRAEIDRGDVWYDFPYTPHGDPRSQPVTRRPALVLYARDGDREVALLRWPTTIGGWKPERLGGRRMGMAYKESPAGERVWRDLIASPVWVPPESAPRRDLVRPRFGGGWAVKQDAFGPGYASAYGLAMLVHHRVASLRNAAEPLRDEGIRTHGSVSYDSIHTGSSHGCHRLHNHMVLRLSSFLLRHRKHVRHGPIELGYARRFAWEGKSMLLSFDSRGYRYELTPPVPVEVLRGRVMGKQLGPVLGGMPLPEGMLGRFTQERFEP